MRFRSSPERRQGPFRLELGERETCGIGNPPVLILQSPRDKRPQVKPSGVAERCTSPGTDVRIRIIQEFRKPLSQVSCFLPQLGKAGEESGPGPRPCLRDCILQNKLRGFLGPGVSNRSSYNLCKRIRLSRS